MIDCGASKQNMEREETRKSDTVSEAKDRHGNSAESLKRACVIKSIIYIIMRKKEPIYKSFCSRAPKTQQICHYRHAKKTSRFE